VVFRSILEKMRASEALKPVFELHRALFEDVSEIKKSKSRKMINEANVAKKKEVLEYILRNIISYGTELNEESKKALLVIFLKEPSHIISFGSPNSIFLEQIAFFKEFSNVKDFSELFSKISKLKNFSSLLSDEERKFWMEFSNLFFPKLRDLNKRKMEREFWEIADLVKEYECGKIDRRRFCETVGIAAVVYAAGEGAANAA